MDINHPADPDNPEGQDEPYHQQVQHQSLSARLPESLGAGVFCTSSLIVESGDMFLIDFVNGSAPPVRLVARVVVTPLTMQQFLSALNQSCEKARAARRQDRPSEATGQPPGVGTETVSAAASAGGKPAGAAAAGQRSVEDIYNELKFTDDVPCGAFANTVIIRHSVDEVLFDFISNYFPRAVVTCRVAMATSRVERFRRSLEDAYRKYEEKHRGF
jgi:hypothetical protein